jgi:hypothetical protein
VEPIIKPIEGGQARSSGMDPYTYLVNLKLAHKMEAERKRRLDQEEASSKRKKMAEVMSKLVSSETPPEVSGLNFVQDTFPEVSTCVRWPE